MRDKVRYFIGAFLLATFVALFARFLLIENFRVSSDSMRPNLVSGDLLLVSKFNYALRIPFTSIEFYRFRNPYPGEVVLFTLPEFGMETYVKRVIALEGDTVQIKDGVLTVNGVQASYGDVATTPGTKREILGTQTERLVIPDRNQGGDYGPAKIPRGHFFVLGDNRGESIDSRKWGPVPLSYLRGKAWLVWMSLAPNGSPRVSRVGFVPKT